MKTPGRRGERGFTLIETLVAATVLIVGVMSTLSLIDRADTTTALTASREQATSLARDLVEAARSIPYTSLDSNAINTKLQAIPGLQSVSGTAYRITRRNVTYRVTTSVCTMDDANDGGGPRPSGLTFCPQSVAANTPNSRGKPDKNPEDYKLVTVTVSWRRSGVRRTVTQTGVVNNPGSATGPQVTSLTPAGEITTPDAPGQSLTVTIGVSSKPTTVVWRIDGSNQAVTPTSDSTGLVWTVPWSIHPLLGSALDDGPYQLEAQAFNQYGVAGPGLSQTVVLNRFRPRAPTHVAGGHNAQGGVDLEWDANTERDILGYDVRRLDGLSWTTVCSFQTLGLNTTCTDPSPPNSPDIIYSVRAWDPTPGTGVARASDKDTQIHVLALNAAPYPPQGLSISSSGGVTTLTWQRPSPQDPDLGDSIAFFRIYRDGLDAGSRYDRWYGSGSTLSWQDTHTGGTTHTYYVSAVDTRYGESTIVGPVTG